MKDPFFFYAVDMADQTTNRHPGGNLCQAMNKMRSIHLFCAQALRPCCEQDSPGRDFIPDRPVFFCRSPLK
jgi:hypothetical protein